MMNPSLIRSLWKPRPGDRAASIAMWDAVADDFRTHDIPSFDDNHLLGIFENRNMLTPQSDVLDVACGAGTYSFAIADRVNSTTGIDISPAMTGHAQERARELNLPGSTFITADWSELDLDAEGLAGRFDLVFAHMTPAVDGPESFDRLSHASRGWCVLSKPTRRRDPISDGLRALLGIEIDREDGASDIVYGFGLLWAQGLLPRLEYLDTVWEHKRPLAKAREFYLNRMRTYRRLDEADAEKADAYLRSIADSNGLVGEKTDVTITTMYWHV